MVKNPTLVIATKPPLPNYQQKCHGILRRREESVQPISGLVSAILNVRPSLISVHLTLRTIVFKAISVEMTIGRLKHAAQHAK